jgi:Ca2+-binding EF-hand superfamily protein
VEVRKAASSLVSSSSAWEPPELMIRLDDPASLSHSIESLVSYCKANGAAKALESMKMIDQNDDQTISQSEFDRLATLAPAIDVSIDFKSESDQCRVLAQSDVQVVRGSALTELGGAIVEVTAVRGAAANLDQISMGIVNDGYPIAPLLDTNEDSRLTMRELRDVPERMKLLDRNNDHQITLSETLPTIRLSIGHGLCVHDQLSTVRSVQPDGMSETAAPPDWFVSLDKNRDGDLSRREFVGTPEQFTKMDRDQDGLISISEATQP